jgi:N-acetylneuraminate lyase
MTLNDPVKNLGGIHAALLTPFDKDDAIDRKSTEALVRFIIGQGVHGLYVSGSSGEAMLQSIDERAECLRHVADCAKGKLKLIAHVGAVATRDVIKLADVARSSGYDAISAVTPYYYQFSRSEVMSHYRTVADNAALPLIIYNFPAITQAFSVAELADLLQHKNIIGVKHTSTDLFALERLRRHCPDALIYNGYDEMWLAGLSMGASGAIGTTYNLMGDLFVAIAKLYEQDHAGKALELQKMANVIIEALIEVGVIPGCKMALDMMGVPVGMARAPFRRLGSEDKIRLQTALAPLLKWREGHA